MIENLEDFLANSSESFAQPTQEKSNPNELIEYRPRPADSVEGGDGIYRSTIKIMRDLRFQGPQSIFNLKRTYFFNQNNQSLPWDVAEKNDPALNVFYNLKRHTNKLISDAIGNTSDDTRMFRMNIADYVLIQVLKDDNKPELQGRIMVWKLPRAIKEFIEARTAKKVSPGYMDPLLGFALNLEVKPGPKDPSNPQRETREISYATSEFDTDMISPMLKTDGTSFLTDEEYDKLNDLALNLNKATKKGLANVDKKQADAVKKQFEACVPLINQKVAEMTEYLNSLGDECVSAVKFVQPKEHSNEDYIRFVEMLSSYMKRIGATQEEVFGVLERCNLIEYSVEATYAKRGNTQMNAGQVGGEAGQAVGAQPAQAAPAQSAAPTAATDLPF